MEWQWRYSDSLENKSTEVERKWIKHISKGQSDISHTHTHTHTHTHSLAVCHYKKPQYEQQMTV